MSEWNAAIEKAAEVCRQKAAIERKAREQWRNIGDGSEEQCLQAALTAMELANEITLLKKQM